MNLKICWSHDAFFQCWKLKNAYQRKVLFLSQSAHIVSVTRIHKLWQSGWLYYWTAGTNAQVCWHISLLKIILANPSAQIYYWLTEEEKRDINALPLRESTQRMSWAVQLVAFYQHKTNKNASIVNGSPSLAHGHANIWSLSNVWSIITASCSFGQQTDGRGP